MTPTERAALMALVRRWLKEAEDANRRGYPESCVQQWSDANDLEALLLTGLPDERKTQDTHAK